MLYDKVHTFKANERIRGNNGLEYQILGSSAIKQGGFSAVYKAHASLDNVGLVAIKAINLDNKKIRRSEHEKRIKSEVRIHKGLEDHPRVIRFVDCFHYEHNEDVFCIVTEFAEQGDLKDYLKRQGGQKLAEPEASRIVEQIVEGVLFFQRNNLVHRDFKLQNILLDKERNIKIADFGLATELSSKNDRMKTFCGTPNYLPPEVIARRGYSSKCDIWSLGVLLYHLLVGRPPFESGETSKETMENIKAQDIYFPELMSECAKDVIRRTLAKNDHDRITIQELADHPFLRAHRGSSSLESCARSQLSDYQVPRPYLPPTPSRTATRELEQKRLRCPSLERLPSGEIMPPPINLSGHKSTGYSSSMSDAISPKGTRKSSPRLLRQAPPPTLNHHQRSRSTGSLVRRRSASLTSETNKPMTPVQVLPEIRVRRLVPTKIRHKNTVSSIRPDERAYVEQLDADSRIKYAIEVDCRTQTAVYYEPRDVMGRLLPLASEPYTPKELEEYRPKHYYHPNIPNSKVAKLWQHLFKFVELLRAKTTKVKIFSDRGQAILKETGDFELLLYDGSKYQKTSKKEVFVDSTQREFDLGEVEVKKGESVASIEHGRSLLESCVRIEEAIESIMGPAAQGNFEYFPVVISRKPRETGFKKELERPSRPNSAPVAARSPLTIHTESNMVNINACPITPPSTIASTNGGASGGSTASRHQHRSKILKEVDFKKFNPDSPVHYACLRSNGTVEFQSEKYYFYDKLKKQEIRVRNGNTYFYEDGGLKGTVPDDIRPILAYWLTTGRQWILPDQHY